MNRKEEKVSDYIIIIIILWQVFIYITAKLWKLGFYIGSIL